MHPANYTPHNLCNALGIGTPEPVLAQGEHAVLRVLLTPSFQPEICLTVRGTAGDARVDVVAARSQIWHQTGIVPAAAATDADNAAIDQRRLDELCAAARLALRPGVPAGKIILDGVRAHAVLRTPGETLAFDAPLGEHAGLDGLVERLLSLAWDAVALPRLRNAIADQLSSERPRFDVPPDKPVFTTMVLGPAEDVEPVLAALRNLHSR